MKAIISGGGIAGLTAALALERAGWDCVVLEKAPAPRSGGYMLDFFGPGYDAAADLGVLDALSARARGVGKLAFVNGRGQTRSYIDYGQVGRATGGKLFPILRGDIERVLYEAVPSSVDTRYGTRLANVEQWPAGVGVQLQDGTAFEADLLVGADGIHSLTRTLVFGPEADFIRPLGFHTAAYFFDSADVARELAGDFKTMAIKGRFAAFYEVDPGRVMAFFVLHGGAETPKNRAEALRTVFGDLGWIVPEALAAMPEGDAVYYDVVAQIEMEQWRKGRTILIGDAAHAVSLVAGQGASLAMAGGRALGQALGGRAPVESALEDFERALRPVVLEKQAAGRRMAKWFVPAGHGHVLARDLAINVMNWPPMSALLGRFFSVGSKGLSPARQ